MKNNNYEEVCSYYRKVRTTVIKIKNKRRTPYEFIYNGMTYARFDNEEKARIYQDAFQEGVSVGFYLKKETP
jgi:hypothetical protein